MERITIIKTDDGTIWVTSDDNGIGVEVDIDECKNEDTQIIAALAEFLGYDAESVLCFD